MELKEYLKANSIKQIEFAEKINVSPGYLCDILNGKKAAGRITALRIEKATEGAVGVRDVLYPPVEA